MAVRNDGIHKGHRQRMRRKFIEHTSRAFDTYELLEMLLYNVIPYKDTNPVSKNLLSAFGSLDGVLRAKREELMAVDGIGAAVADFILSVSDFASLMNERRTGEEKLCLDTFVAAGRYFVDFLRETKGDNVAMMLLDNRMNLIDIKVIYNKKYSSGGVHAYPFLDYAIQRRASVALTAHTGEDMVLYPTIGDMETSRMIHSALSAAGVAHLEHYLTSSSQFIGSLSKFKYRYNVCQSPEIAKFLRSREEYDGAF